MLQGAVPTMGRAAVVNGAQLATYSQAKQKLLEVGSEVVERVDNFTYLGSLISPNGLVSDKISARIRKARKTFANLRHLWRRRDIRLSIKGRVYC
ncbi:unnamed protein product, partial [Schistosoma margrebowiei]